MPEATSTLAAFQNRRYLVYWLTGLSGNFGWLIQLVGISWLMTVISSAPEQVALVQTALAVPVMVFSLFAGALADSFGRLRVAIWSQVFLFAVSLSLAVTAWHGFLTPSLLLGFTFLIGCGRAIHNPGWQTLVSEFMPRDELPGAVAMNSVGFNLARTLGPAIGGAIVAAIGAFAAFVAGALGSLGVVAVLSRWKGEKLPRDLPPERIGSAMAAGLRYVAMSPHILLVLVRAAAFNLAAGAVMALMPLIARDLLGGGARTYGLLLGAFGLGAVAGAFVITRLRQRLALENLARIGFVSFAVAAAVIALSRNEVLTMLALAFAGASWLSTQSTFNSTVQMASPRWVLSRCLALYQTASFGGNALGSWLWGSLAGSVGVSGALVGSAIAMLLGAALGLWLTLREFDTLGLDPFSRWTAPKAGLDIRPQSGPFLNTTEYLIDEGDVPAFLALMTERRRSRTRNGARRWSLARDIEDPSLWIERYQTPTWVETVRLHRRWTRADADVGEQIRALHRGSGQPIRRHFLDRATDRAGAGEPLPHAEMHHH